MAERVVGRELLPKGDDLRKGDRLTSCIRILSGLGGDVGGRADPDPCAVADLACYLRRGVVAGEVDRRQGWSCERWRGAGSAGHGNEPAPARARRGPEPTICGQRAGRLPWRWAAGVAARSPQRRQIALRAGRSSVRRTI